MKCVRSCDGLLWFSFLVSVALCNSVTLTMSPDLTIVQGSTLPTYTCRLEFGSPPQAVDVIVDGGLDLFYLFTPQCTQRGCGTAYFFPNQSSTLQYENISLNYTYAAGNLNILGQVAVDQGTVGGIPDIKQQFALITKLSQPVYYPPSNELVSGVFGFAFPSPSFGGLSLLRNLIQQNQLDSVVSLWTPYDMYESGIMTIGAIDENLFSGPLNYVPLLPSTFAKKDYPFFWSNIVSDIKINGVSNGYCQRKTCDFFIDLAARPMDLAGAIPSINVFPDCSNINTLDTYTLVIGGVDYTLTPQDYVLQIQNGTTTTCETGIYGGSRIPYPFTLGYTWIRNFFTILDFGNQQIGFAPSKAINKN